MLAFKNKNNQTMVVREKEKVGYNQKKKKKVGIGEIFKGGEFNAILLRQG